MVDLIELDEERLPKEEGFKLAIPGVLVTSLYLSKVKDRIERGLRDVDEYPEFIESFQMDLLMFFVVGTEEIKERCKYELVSKVVADSVISDGEYNEMLLIDQLREEKFWEYSVHYDLDVVMDGPGSKSVRELVDLRNTMVHDPDEFADEPPSPGELVDYINSTLEIVEYLEE